MNHIFSDSLVHSNSVLTWYSKSKLARYENRQCPVRSFLYSFYSPTLQPFNSELDPISIESLINYAYDGSLTITESNAQDIMRAANFLLMVSQISSMEQSTPIIHLLLKESIADECAHFLLKRIAFDDALPLLSFYNSLNYTKLESLLSFIDARFNDGKDNTQSLFR